MKANVYPEENFSLNSHVCIFSLVADTAWERLGPKLPLMWFGSVDDVVDQTNAAEHDLGATIWSSFPEQPEAIPGQLHSGTVRINESLCLSPQMSFGCIREFGVGMEGIQNGLLSFTVSQIMFVPRLGEPS